MNRPSELWTDEVLAAQATQDSGALDQAAADFERLAANSPSPKAQRWVWWEWGQLEESRGELEAALQLYQALYKSDDIDSYGANAGYRTALIQEKRGNYNDAFRTKFWVLLHYPNEIAAEHALKDILNNLRTRAPNTAKHTLQRLYPALLQTYLADNVLYLEADLCRNELGDDDCALALYRQIYVEHPSSGLADDALWQMAQIYQSRGMWAQAVDSLEVMANNTETSWFVGTYNSEWVDDAVYQLAMIHLLFYQDYDTAVSYFMRYADEFEFSLRADDALWDAAEARRLQGRDDMHFYQLRILLRRFPESRYAPKARARLGIPDEAT